MRCNLLGLNTCWRSSIVELRFCKPVVVGANPTASSIEGYLRLKIETARAWRSSASNGRPVMEEGTIFNDTLNFLGMVPKRSKGADCKSVGLCLRGFESLPSHHPSRAERSEAGRRVPSEAPVPRMREGGHAARFLLRQGFGGQVGWQARGVGIEPLSD